MTSVGGRWVDARPKGGAAQGCPIAATKACITGGARPTGSAADVGTHADATQSGERAEPVWPCSTWLCMPHLGRNVHAHVSFYKVWVDKWTHASGCMRTGWMDGHTLCGRLERSLAPQPNEDQARTKRTGSKVTRVTHVGGWHGEVLAAAAAAPAHTQTVQMQRGRAPLRLRKSDGEAVVPWGGTLHTHLSKAHGDVSCALCPVVRRVRRAHAAAHRCVIVVAAIGRVCRARARARRCAASAGANAVICPRLAALLTRQIWVHEVTWLEPGANLSRPQPRKTDGRR
eukprot:261334-Chlamydomonas_euryale.AAC.8